MDFLYACHFSNGLVKVGRSHTPKIRIERHADRVACLGLKLVASHVAECVDDEEREQALINRCVEGATARHQHEWFEGLGFAEVCRWVDECANDDLRAFATLWMRLIDDLRIKGWLQGDIARECGVSKSNLNRLAVGHADEPRYSVGVKLIALHASVTQKSPA